MVRKRKKRSDRNHIVYRLENSYTGESYIGISAVARTPLMALRERFRRHVSKATHENKNWKLHKLLRKFPDPSDWEMQIIGKIRGRKNAHQLERSLIEQFSPELNTF